LRIFINTLLVIVAIPPFVRRRFRQCEKIFGARSAKVESGFAGQTSSFCPEIVLQNIEIAHDLIAKRSHPRVTPEDVLWRIRRKRLSTLKIRVKRRLSIWCHRPAVSF
jgi:hypothetical protein